MIDIEKHTFIKYFAPTKLEGKRKVTFKNGSLIKTKYKSEFEYWVKYLPGNYADNYAPNFIIKMDEKLRIIPVPNFYTFLFIPLVIAILFFKEEMKIKELWNIILALILFITLIQAVLIYPSIRIIKKRINERI